MLFDTSLRRELARSFGATLVVILTIVLTVMLMQAIGSAAKGMVDPQDIVLMMGYATLLQMTTMLAASLFIAIVSTIGRLYRDSEMAIWLSSGVGVRRFVRPVLRMAWPVLLVVLLLVLFVRPWVNQQSTEVRDRYQSRSDFSRVTPGVFQSSRDGSRVFFVERDLDESSGQSNARNVFIQALRDERETLVTARSGRLEERGQERWFVMQRGQFNETNAASGDKSLATFDRYEVLAGEKALQQAARTAPRVMSTFDLIRVDDPAALGELTWRLGVALGAFNLTLIGLGLAARNPRKPSNWGVLFALLVFVVYYNLINVSSAWVTSGRLSVPVALLTLHGTALVLAVTLLWWRDHGTVMRLNPFARQRRSNAVA